MNRLLLSAVCLVLLVGRAGADDVLDFVKQLKDKDEIVRLKAAKALGKLGAGAKIAIPALTEVAAKDEDPDVRSVAKQALENIKEAAGLEDKKSELATLEQALKDVKSPDPAVRNKAVQTLAKLLKATDEIVRLKAAQALGEAGVAANPVVADLKEATRDDDEGVRRVARKSLEKIEQAVVTEKRRKTAELLTPLVADLKSKTPATRLKALEDIAKYGADAKDVGAEVVQALIVDQTPVIKQTALETLEKIDPPVYKQIVLLLVDRDPSNQLGAVGAIGTMGPDGKAALPALLFTYQNCLAAGQPDFALFCIPAMAKVAPDDSRVIQLILAAVADKGVNVGGRFRRAFRIEGIAAAKEAKIDPKLLVPVLLGAFNDGLFRVQVIDALGDLGRDAADAITPLNKLKFDSAFEVREAVKRALDKIDK